MSTQQRELAFLLFFVEICENQDDEIIGRILNEKQEITMIAKYKK